MTTSRAQNETQFFWLMEISDGAVTRSDFF